MVRPNRDEEGHTTLQLQWKQLAETFGGEDFVLIDIEQRVIKGWVRMVGPRLHGSDGASGRIILAIRVQELGPSPVPVEVVPTTLTGGPTGGG